VHASIEMLAGSGERSFLCNLCNLESPLAELPHDHAAYGAAVVDRQNA
jgi:hypothetical protein